MSHQQQTAFENIVGKGEIAHNEQFLLFPRCFLPNQIIVSPSVNIFDIVSLFGAEFEKPKIGKSGKGLIPVVPKPNRYRAHDCGVRGREVERRPCNHEVPSSSPGSGSQLWDFSLAHIFGASTGVVPRKQNRERLV